MVDSLLQGAVGADDGLDAARQQIAQPIPVAQVHLVDVIGDRLGGMPGEGFVERHVQVVAVGRATVVGAQLGEHVAVAVGVEDAFDDDVVSGVKGVAGVRSIKPMFAAPGRSRSRRTKRRRLSWPTNARPRPNLSRRPAATDDFLEAALPCSTTSRVSSVPTHHSNHATGGTVTVVAVGARLLRRPDGRVRRPSQLIVAALDEAEVPCPQRQDPDGAPAAAPPETLVAGPGTLDRQSDVLGPGDATGGLPVPRSPWRTGNLALVDGRHLSHQVKPRGSVDWMRPRRGS